MRTNEAEITFDDYLKKQLENEDFKKEWDEIQPEIELRLALIEARASQDIY